MPHKSLEEELAEIKALITAPDQRDGEGGDADFRRLLARKLEIERQLRRNSKSHRRHIA